MKCPGIDAIRINGIDCCTLCGEPMGASGCDGGSWVHTDTSPDRVVQTNYCGGKWVSTRLANGVVWRAK